MDPTVARVLALLDPICGSSVARLATLPPSFRPVAASLFDVPPDSFIAATAVARQLAHSGPLRHHGLASFDNSGQFKPPGHLWVETLACGSRLGLEHICVILEEVFLEAYFVNTLNRSSPPTYYSFADRCRASNCEALIPALDLDLTSRPRALHTPRGLRPLAVLTSLGTFLPRGPLGPRDAVRHPTDLAAEAGLRARISSIAASWKQYRAGLRCWVNFLRTCFPGTPTTVMLDTHVQAFASLFENPDTLTNYLSHVRWGFRLLNLDCEPSVRLGRALCAGPRRYRPVGPRPSVSSAQVALLVQAALADEDRLSALAYILAYSFLLRVQSELFPLQRDGRSAADWHSWCSLSPSCGVLHFRSRKNAPGGDSITRPCVCAYRRPCGSCALAALCSRQNRRGILPAQPLFPSSCTAAMTTALRLRASRIGLGPVGWHSFRRGAASDLLASGGTLAQVLHAGNWRSAAFLRYLRTRDVDTRAAFEAAAADSD